MDVKNIGLALSGGGIRATVFHLGVIKWMAENKMLGNISKISSVSGASLAIGLIFSHNLFKWPTDSDFIDIVLPKIRKIILNHDIQKAALKKLIVAPCYWNKKVNLLSNILEKKWQIKGFLSDIGETPKWYVNCTTFETGKRFRFTKNNMGDYVIGYVKNPVLKIADIVAASAGFPILIGPYKLRTKDYVWEKSKIPVESWSPPADKYLHLWDGGVYDNLGMESIFKPNGGGKLSDDINFMIVSDASNSLDYSERKAGFNFRGIKRLLDISMDQNRSLRSRTIVDYLKREKKGMYIDIGNNVEQIIKKSNSDILVMKPMIEKSLSYADSERVRMYKTTLSKPSESAFDLLLRHGYEVAVCTYTCYHN